MIVYYAVYEGSIYTHASRVKDRLVISADNQRAMNVSG